MLQIQLMGSGDPSLRLCSGTANAVGRWRAYMDSYVLHDPTELLGGEVVRRVRLPFMKR